MKSILLILSLGTALLLAFSLVSSAQEIEVGQEIILQERKPGGVPLHKDHPPNFWKHIPTGTRATIEDIGEEGRWIAVRLVSGEKAWVNLKYILIPSLSPTPPNKVPSSFSTESSDGGTSQEARVWASPGQCKEVVKAGGRMSSDISSMLRLGTWNLRWFPAGKTDTQSDETADPTDLEWLACTVLWMKVDILAVQESLATPEARDAWDSVTRLLREQSGDSWRWTPQICGRPDDHHIGFLWNANRVTLSHIDSLWQFNVKAKSSKRPCQGGLRPGHYARVRSRQQNGVDFHLIALHLKSGPTVFAVEDRHNALNKIDQAIAPLLEQDQDVVILGDLNTMGAGDRNSQRYELKSVLRQVAKEKPGFQSLPATPPCTHYFRGRGGWLDHVLVTKGMQEVTEPTARVTGYCAIAECRRIKGDYPLAYRRLSDHCPVIMGINNRDED